MTTRIPNLRNVKPAIQYRNERCRIFGRERIANETSRSVHNAKVIPVGMKVECAEMLEVYKNNLRLLEGYTVNGDTVVFPEFQEGEFTFVMDTTVIDPGEKFLRISFKELIDHKSTTDAAYTTDRRTTTPDIKTRVTPVVMIRPTIGWCRPDTYGESLLYCPLFGMYGRDAITYALRTDGGQLSEFRCINIRVLDPNYVPDVRGLLVFREATWFKINNEEHFTEIQEGNEFAQIITKDLTNVMTPPNIKTLSEQQQVTLIIQLKDELGDWYDLSEFYEPEEFELEVTGTDRYRVDLAYTETGLPGNMVQITMDRMKTENIGIRLSCMGKERYAATIKTVAIEDTEYERRGDIEFEFDPDVHYTGSSNLETTSLVVDFEAPTTFTAIGSIELHSDYFGPNGGSVSQTVDVDYSQNINEPTSIQDVIELTEERMVWGGLSPFSQMYRLQAANYTIHLEVFATEPEPEEPEEEPETP